MPIQLLIQFSITVSAGNCRRIGEIISLSHIFSSKYRRAFCRTIFPHTIARRFIHTSSADKYFVTRKSPTFCGTATGQHQPSAATSVGVRRNVLDVPSTASVTYHYQHNVNNGTNHRHIATTTAKKRSMLVSRRPAASLNEISRLDTANDHIDAAVVAARAALLRKQSEQSPFERFRRNVKKM